MEANKNFCKFEDVSFATLMSFGRNEENRDITLRKHRKHIQDIKELCKMSLATMPPIIVNLVTNNILDGQSRTKALEELYNEGAINDSTPIHIQYVAISCKEEIEFIRKLCSGHKDWALEDYIQSYVKGSNPNTSYKILDDFSKTHALTSSNGQPRYCYAATILNPEYNRNDLKYGKLNINQLDVQRAEELHQELYQILEVLDLVDKPKFWIEPLTKIWGRYRDRYDFKTWLRVIKRRKDYIKKRSATNLKEWNEIFSCLITWKEKQDKNQQNKVAE